jgi:hypothetical protein
MSGRPQEALTLTGQVIAMETPETLRPLEVAKRWQQLDAAVQRMPSLGGLLHVDPCRIRFAHVGHGNALTAITRAFKSRTAYELSLAALASVLDPEGRSEKVVL